MSAHFAMRFTAFLMRWIKTSILTSVPSHPLRLCEDMTRQLKDFAAMRPHHQASPDSSFTHNRICPLATSDGRITSSGTKFIVTQNGNRDERIPISEQERASELQHFGITEPPAQL